MRAAIVAALAFALPVQDATARPSLAWSPPVVFDRSAGTILTVAAGGAGEGLIVYSKGTASVALGASGGRRGRRDRLPQADAAHAVVTPKGAAAIVAERNGSLWAAFRRDARSRFVVRRLNLAAPTGMPDSRELAERVLLTASRTGWRLAIPGAPVPGGEGGAPEQTPLEILQLDSRGRQTARRTVTIPRALVVGPRAAGERILTAGLDRSSAPSQVAIGTIAPAGDYTEVELPLSSLQLRSPDFQYWAFDAAADGSWVLSWLEPVNCGDAGCRGVPRAALRPAGAAQPAVRTFPGFEKVAPSRGLGGSAVALDRRRFAFLAWRRDTADAFDTFGTIVGGWRAGSHTTRFQLSASDAGSASIERLGSGLLVTTPRGDGRTARAGLVDGGRALTVPPPPVGGNWTPRDELWSAPSLDAKGREVLAASVGDDARLRVSLARLRG